ncbi:MAG: acetylxylan esterase, partial [Planctomycetia bacterium]|nr:acetylxylan esterase [Planctomycetia bacterium]
FGGERITTKEQWFEKRRPELKQLLQHYMYGYLPAAPAKVEAKLEREDKQALGGKATLREIELSFGPPETPKLHLLLITPNGRKGPAPVFLGLNFRGNHTVLNDPKIRLTTAWLSGNYPGVKDNRATDTGRATHADVWNVEQIIERGYALATMYNGEIAPDRPDAPERMQLHYPKKVEGQPGPHDWATIAAWSWGLHRAVDFLVTDSAIDKAKIVVVGHSRLGKTALVAAAFDDRIAISMPHQAGCGGTAPSRGKVGESVKQINDRFPHWFNATFKQFNEQPERLPFDQHCLAAVVAPRPVLFTNAVEDTWANPDGQFQVLLATDPVYRLLGASGLDAKKPPEVNTLIDSKLGYFIRPGKHSMTKDDWKVFLDFADKHLGKPNG